MIDGSTPAMAMDRIRAIGDTPRDFARSDDTIIMAAAPSDSADDVPAVAPVPPEPATTVRRAPEPAVRYERPAATAAPAAEPVETEVIDDTFDRPPIEPLAPQAEDDDGDDDDDGKPMSAARRIAMLAREADVDRAAVATIASAGRTHGRGKSDGVRRRWMKLA